MRALGRGLGLVLFFLMLCIPTTYQLFKAALLAVLLLMIAMRGLRDGRFPADRAIVLITLGMVCTGLAFTLVGVVRGAPDALGGFNVYVTWPLVFLILVAGADDWFLKRAHSVFVIASIAIAAYSILFILYAAQVLPAALYVRIDVGAMIGFYPGLIEFSTTYIPTLLFLVPYFTATLLAMPGSPDDPISRRWAWIALTCGMLIVLLSGRRGLILVVGLAPIVTLALRALLRRDAPWLRRIRWVRVLVAAAVIVIGLVAYLGRIYGFDPAALARRFVAGFQFATGVESAVVRRLQFHALLGDWAESPLIGFGFGAKSPASLRWELQWDYEMSYLALLYHTGIVGFSVYAAAVGWIYVQAIRAIRTGEAAMRALFPILVGTTCFLIANATNPYLAKYDFMWVLFLPVMYVNTWRLSHTHPTGTRSSPPNAPHLAGGRRG